MKKVIELNINGDSHELLVSRTIRCWKCCAISWG